MEGQLRLATRGGKAREVGLILRTIAPEDETTALLDTAVQLLDSKAQAAVDRLHKLEITHAASAAQAIAPAVRFAKWRFK